MRKLSALLIVLSSVCGLRAQSSNSEIVAISAQQCVWHAGDDSAWAAANLDETGWRPSTQWKPKYGQTRFWVRCHLDSAALRDLDHPALQIRALAAYEAFFNGVLIARNGNLESGNFGMNSIQVFPIPLPIGHDREVLSLRVVQRYATLISAPEIRLGDEQVLVNDRAGYLLGIMPSELLQDLPFIAIGIVGLVLLIFSLPERSRPEVILLGVNCVGAGLVFLDLLCAHLMLNEPVWLSDTLGGVGGAASFAAQFLFPFALAKRRVPAFFWIPIGISILPAAWQIVEFFVPLQVALLLDGIHTFLLTPISFGAAALIGTAPLVAFWPWNRVPRHLRIIAAFCLAWYAGQSVFFAAALSALNIPGIPNVFRDWMFPASTIAQVCVIVAIIALILREQRLIALDRASLAGEMQAASEIQRMLAPAAIDTAAGLKIDVAFHPMSEVGGDFYVGRVLSDGRQRVLVGDFSGKGAAAAMAATLLLGAAAARDSDSPSSLLAHLNRVLCENHLSGFATCLCADIEPSGQMTLANAGHLPPYLDGSEIELDSGLPLGISSESAYNESIFRLDFGTQLTLLSDGIVEARNTAGELFGFERTIAISGESAQSIARAAHEFGQEDDITVLTLTRKAAVPGPAPTVRSGILSAQA